MESNHKTDTIKKRFQSELKGSFNEAKFDEDVQSGKEISLDLLDEYKKKKEILPNVSPQKEPDENEFF